MTHKKLPIASMPFTAWVVDNQNFVKPDWWNDVNCRMKDLYYNYGPKILETVKTEDYLI